MRNTPLLIILLCTLLSTRVCAADDGAMEASTISSAAVLSTVAQESTYKGAAVESRRTTAASFDFSYFIVLTLGVAGLVWVRRQSQSL